MAGTSGTKEGSVVTDSDRAAAAPVAQTRWGVVSLAILAGVVVGFAVGKVPPTIGLISDEFGLDKVAAGWLASIFFAFGAGFGVMTGMVGGRVGARALLLTGVLVLVLSGVAGALATGAAMLLVVRVFEGISFAAITAAAPKITFDATRPEDRDLALGIWSGYMPGGMALAMVVAPFLAEPLGWRSLWWLMAGAALIAAALVVLGTTRRRWPEQPRRDVDAGFDWSGVRATLSVGALWLYGGAFLLFTVQWFAIAAWLPTFLIETQGRGPIGAALFSALVVATNVIGNLIGGWLLHRQVPRYALVGAANVIMAVTGVLILAGSLPDVAKIPLAIIFSTGSGILPAAAYAGAAVHAPKPDLVAMANGFMAQGAAIGMLIGPPLMAVVVGGLGSWEAAWWCMLICPAIGLAVSAGLFGIERRRPVAGVAS